MPNTKSAGAEKEKTTGWPTISSPDADQILRQVLEAVSHWRHHAERIGLSRREIEMMEKRN